MKLYKFNSNLHSFEEFNPRLEIIFIVSTFILLVLITYELIDNNEKITYIDRVIRLEITNEGFSKENLEKELISLNIKFPDIVLAQAILETNNFKSRIFLENHNLFGMKPAAFRPTTSRGILNGHAYYTNWKESVLDYALYQAAYARSINTEDDYYKLLVTFAEDTSYIKKLKNIQYGN